MKFIIRRTSRKEVKNTKKEKVWYYDYRTFPNINAMKKDTKKKWIQKWFEEGRNHRNIEDPTPDVFGNVLGVVREIEKEEQFIEIEDIIKWIEDLGERVLISPPKKDYPNYVDILWEIEIVDGFLC